MILGIGKETAILLYACLSGITVFLSYQMLYLFRLLLRHPAFVTGIEDLLYWVAVSVYIFHQMYRTIYGSVRWFFVLGVVLGCLIAWSGKNCQRKSGRNGGKNLKKGRKKDRIDVVRFVRKRKYPARW